MATALAFSVAGSLGLLAPGFVAFVVAEFALLVAPIAITGRPIGALVFRTVVIRSTEHTVPGWSTSARRWFVAHLPILIVALVALFDIPDAAAVALALLQVAGLTVVYSGVFFHPNGQGLHDRVAKTLVVLHRRDAHEQPIDRSDRAIGRSRDADVAVRCRSAQVRADGDGR